MSSSHSSHGPAASRRRAAVGDPQVVPHGQGREHAAPLGHEHQAAARRWRWAGGCRCAGRRGGSTPDVTGSVPEIARSVVVLPTPFGPSRATTEPAGHVEADAVEHLDAAVAGAHVVELEGVAHDAPSSDRHAEVGLAHLRRSLAISLGRALGDALAEVEDVDPRRTAPSPARRRARRAGCRRRSSATWRSTSWKASVSPLSRPLLGSSSSSTVGSVHSARPSSTRRSDAGAERAGQAVGARGRGRRARSTSSTVATIAGLVVGAAAGGSR